MADIWSSVQRNEQGFAIFALALARSDPLHLAIGKCDRYPFFNAVDAGHSSADDYRLSVVRNQSDQTARAVAGEQGVNLFSFARMLQGLAYNYIFHFLIALLIAAVVKKKAVPVPGS